MLPKSSAKESKEPSFDLFQYAESKGFKYDPSGIGGVYEYFRFKKTKPDIWTDDYLRENIENKEIDRKDYASEHKATYKLDTFKKFHIGLSGHNRKNPLRDLETRAILDILAEYQVGLKIVMIKPGRPYQYGKDITIYQATNLHLSDAKWDEMFQKINNALKALRTEYPELAKKLPSRLGTETKIRSRKDTDVIGDFVSYRWDPETGREHRKKREMLNEGISWGSEPTSSPIFLKKPPPPPPSDAQHSSLSENKEKKTSIKVGRQ